MSTLFLYLVSPWALPETGHEATQPIEPLSCPVISGPVPYSMEAGSPLPFSKHTTLPSNKQLLVFKYDQYHPNPWPFTSVSCQSLRLWFLNWPCTSNAISITHSPQGLWHQFCINPSNALLLPQASHQEPQIPKVRFGRWKEGVKVGRSDLGKEG